MPPSAGACHTTSAELRPDCGRAANWSSIITATTWRLATSGFTSRPVSGAGTRLGVGFGVGLGGAVGLGSAVGGGDSVAAGGAVGSGVGDGDGDGELDATATGGGVAPVLMIPPARTPTASPTPSVSATTSPARALLIRAGRSGRARDGARSTPIVQAWVDDHGTSPTRPSRSARRIPPFARGRRSGV